MSLQQESDNRVCSQVTVIMLFKVNEIQLSSNHNIPAKKISFYPYYIAESSLCLSKIVPPDCLFCSLDFDAHQTVAKFSRIQACE